MKIAQKLVDAAIRLIEDRYPEGDWKGAAAVYTSLVKLLQAHLP